MNGPLRDRALTASMTDYEARCRWSAFIFSGRQLSSRPDIRPRRPEGPALVDSRRRFMGEAGIPSWIVKRRLLPGADMADAGPVSRISPTYPVFLMPAGPAAMS